MSLRKDGSSKRSASYMPYDSSNSFVKKMANKVTGLIGWRSQSQSSVISQTYDNLSNLTDEDHVSPTPKRIRIQSEEQDSLLKLIPSTSKGTNELCSPIQPINNVHAASTSNRNQCFVASTPASMFSSTSVQSSPKHTTLDSDGTDSLDNNESENAPSTAPPLSVLQRHNVTVPAISRDVPSQVSNLDSSRRTGSFSISNSHRPSFNVDVLSNSNRRLSMSVCENRNVTSLSPFYSARTMYGGASALLPYGRSSMSRLRSASTSRLNLFSPRSQITIQPIPPSRDSCNNDQETLSASARRILDTLEKYCSPVMDAKRIPVNESRTSGSKLASQPTPSKGLKRKLPTLSQMTPSTTDLLRIKRQEKMQDSVSSARQVVSTVLESTIAADDSDSSSDSVDLDYSSLKSSDANTANDRKYIGKTRRKDEKKLFDHTVLPPLKLPNAVLKITSLPKFDITDTFTFSKPLLLENLEQNVTEETSSESAVASSTVKNDSSSQTSLSGASSMAASTLTDNKRISFRPSPESRNEEVTSLAMSKVTPQFLVKSKTSENDSVSSKSSSISSPKSKTLPWTCKVCLLESTGESCSSCTSTLVENKKPIDLPKPPTDEVGFSSLKTLTSGWGDKFKPASDTWECKECFVRNASAESKCVACASPRSGTNPTAGATTSANELWKSVPKPATSPWTFGVSTKDATNPADSATEFTKPKFSFGVEKVDASASALNETKLDIDKTSTSVSFGVDSVTSVSNVAITTKPTFTFGFDSPASSTSFNAVPTLNSNNVNASMNSGLAFPFGQPITKTAVTTATSMTNSVPTFSFGDQNSKSTPAVSFSFDAGKGSDTIDSRTSNVSGTKNPLTDGLSSKSTADKPTDFKKNASVLNDVSSITNNTKNPLLKTTADTVSSNDVSVFKSPKPTSVFESTISSKENGDDQSISNNVFNAASPSAMETPPKKKNILFPSYSSQSSTPSVFGSNGFAKPEISSSLSNSTTTSISSNPVTNLFSGSFSSPNSSKPNIEIQTSPSFGVAPNKMDSIGANDANKNSKLFTSTSNFGASSTQQQPPSNSVFGGFGSAKLESQATNNTAFSASPMFSFGSSSSTPSQPVGVNQQSGCGGFTFNGPKTEDQSSTKFMFGNTTNSNYPTSSPLVLGNAPPFTNSNFSSNITLTNAGTSQFNFSSSATNDQSKSMNSIFPPPTPSLKDFQSNSNALPTFGNSVFGNTSQPANQTMNATKKSGGFSFPTPSQFSSQPVNNFGTFGSVTTENQDQNSLNTNAAPGMSPYIFGTANLTVPSRFNFTGGNASPTFSAQPAAINSTASSGLPPRRIKKAVRRTAK